MNMGQMTTDQTTDRYDHAQWAEFRQRVLDIVTESLDMTEAMLDGLEPIGARFEGTLRLDGNGRLEVPVKVYPVELFVEDEPHG